MADLPDYLDKDVSPQPEALDAALEAFQRRTTPPVCTLCHLPLDRCVCEIWEGLAGELPRPWPEPQP